MSNRVFKGFNNNNISDILEREINRTTIKIVQPTTVANKNCFRLKTCNTLNIENYTTLKVLETKYNDLSGNADTGEIYFNGNMNHANYLQGTIENSNIVVKQLIYNLTDDMSLNLTTSTSINENNENLFVIDPSGIIFDTCCNNLFLTQNQDISYGIRSIPNNPIPINDNRLC